MQGKRMPLFAKPGRMKTRKNARPSSLQLVLTIALLALAANLRPASAWSQASYAGRQDVRSIWAGGECSWFSASFPYQSGQHISGCGAFANVRFTYHLDVEGNARWLAFGGYAGTTERSLLIGPRYIVHRYGKFEPYGKFLIGQGEIQYPYGIGSGSYFALAPGDGVNYRASRRLTVRAEYEYQFWLDSPGFGLKPQHALHPNGINVGVAYRLLYF